MQPDPFPFVASIGFFALAIFLGFELITKVPATLHTPLMSGSNAISGITIVGAMICSYSELFDNSDLFEILGVVFGALAVIFATINVVGGYVVTNRMLRMFNRDKK